jgi:hypothetical protein
MGEEEATSPDAINTTALSQGSVSRFQWTIGMFLRSISSAVSRSIVVRVWLFRAWALRC